MNDGAIIKRPDQQGSLVACLKPGRAVAQAGSLAAILRPTRRKLQVAFAGDTTGSMFPFFRASKDAIARVASEVSRPEKMECEFLYIAYKNHGDESCFDDDRPFMATAFTKDVGKLKNQLESVGGGGGGDGLTAIEDVLHHLNTTTVAWQRDAVKILVLIGDMPPHGVVDGMHVCPHEYDYRAETDELVRRGVKIHTVYCHEEAESASKRQQKVKGFFQNTAKAGGGVCLELADIDELVQLMIAVCEVECEGDLTKFRERIKLKGSLSSSLNRNLKLLEDGHGKR